MITTIAGADLGPTNVLLQELVREYYTQKNERFQSNSSTSAAHNGSMLWNFGEGDEKILLERIYFVAAGEATFTYGPVISDTNWQASLPGLSLFIGGANSTIGKTLFHTAPPLSALWGTFHFPVGSVTCLDFGGIIIPAGKGLGFKVTEAVARDITFIWRDIL